MKIAINISPLKSAHKYRGIGFYTKNLIEALKKYKPENEYIFFTRTANLPENADLVHYPYFDVFNWTLPLFKKKPTVVTIHDLTPLVFPDNFPRGIKGEIKWRLQKFSLKNASAIITDSENSKKDIIKFAGFLKEKVHVISLSAAKEFRKLEIGNCPVKRDPALREKLEITQKYQLPDVFVLYVGDINWNKNILGLIKAFSTIQLSNHLAIKLVLVGKAFKNKELKETQEIDELINQLGIKDSVLKLGFVSNQDLTAIYNLASVYCQPSFYEGFGLPCLEAMACGTPVIAANIAALKEVCGEAAIYVDPHNADEIASGILKVIKSGGLPAGKAGSNHQALIEKGLKQAKKFSWKKVAKETVEVYKRAISESVNQEK